MGVVPNSVEPVNFFTIPTAGNVEAVRLKAGKVGSSRICGFRLVRLVRNVGRRPITVLVETLLWGHWPTVLLEKFIACHEDSITGACKTCVISGSCQILPKNDGRLELLSDSG